MVPAELLESSCKDLGIFSPMPTVVGKLLCPEEGWYLTAHSKLVVAQAPDSLSSPFPLPWGGPVAVGPFPHLPPPPPSLLVFTGWNCCCWLHGDFRSGDSEVQGYPGASDVKSRGLSHESSQVMARQANVLIWL